MLVKPKQWVSPDQGGYIYNKSKSSIVLLHPVECLVASAMRFKESVEQLSYLKHASALGNIELVYAGLDVLGNTPWKINRKLFDVVLEVWNSGERMGKLPPAVFDQPEPTPTENYETDLRARSIYLQRLKGYSQQKANNHSDRCSVNYKIEIARAVGPFICLYLSLLFNFFFSSSVMNSTSLTTSISVDVPIPFPRISTTLAMTFLAVF